MSVLSEEHATNVRKSLAMLALQERRADILKMCMDYGGFLYEGYFEDEANRVEEEKDPETFRVLENSGFCQLYPKPDDTQQNSDSDDDSGMGYDDQELDDRARTRIAADFDVGGQYPIDW